jgi:hypothetical protein
MRKTKPGQNLEEKLNESLNPLQISLSILTFRGEKP